MFMHLYWFQELNISDHVIREIVNQTETDPVFESILNLFDGLLFALHFSVSFSIKSRV